MGNNFFLLYLQNNYNSNKLTKPLVILYSCLVFEDLTDRLFFNIQTYELNDLLALAIGLYLSKKEYDRH